MNGVEPNSMYFRYWHGSLVFVRPLLLFWNIKQIYAFNAVVLATLFLLLARLLLRNGMKTEVTALVASLVVVSAWFVPWCLEYTWMFLLMLAISIVAVKMELKEKNLGMLFFVTGIVTIFLDFFTTELLTLLIPLMLVLRIRERKGRRLGHYAIKNSFLWCIGYTGMWTMKWGIVSFVLEQNAFKLTESHIKLHLRIESSHTQLQSLLVLLLP